MLNHMTSDYGIQGIVRNTCKSVDIKVDVEIGCRTVGKADEFRPVFVAAPLDGTIRIANTRTLSDGKRIITWADLEHVARERLSDNATRIHAIGG